MAMMTRRQEGAYIKQAILAATGMKASVRMGRGTAWSWRDITTPQPIPREIERALEEDFVAARVCGTYLPDSLPGLDERTPCISWRVER